MLVFDAINVAIGIGLLTQVVVQFESFIPGVMMLLVLAVWLVLMIASTTATVVLVVVPITIVFSLGFVSAAIVNVKTTAFHFDHPILSSLLLILDCLFSLSKESLPAYHKFSSRCTLLIFLSCLACTHINSNCIEQPLRFSDITF
jgi:hypothetical protein